MAMSATLKITNHTGHTITFLEVDKVNDDATWSGIKTGDHLSDGQHKTLAMGNSSFFLAPRGVGADIYFISLDSPMQMGRIYFDDPAVGAHSFQFDYANQKNFKYDVTNPSGNNYSVAIRKK